MSTTQKLIEAPVDESIADEIALLPDRAAARAADRKDFNALVNGAFEDWL